MVCHRYAITWWALKLYTAAGPAFHSTGIRANARVGFLGAKTAPRQTKPNGCIVFLVPVLCSGQRRQSAGAQGVGSRACHVSIEREAR